MTTLKITREKFLEDNQGRTFLDIVNDPEQPFNETLNFFNDENKQRRMEESEIHHDRPPLAGVVRELESIPTIDQALAEPLNKKSLRFRQSIGVLIRMIMEGRGWVKTGRKGSLGVRVDKDKSDYSHNIGGLAFWFIRAERYVRAEGMPFQSVRERCNNLDAGT